MTKGLRHYAWPIAMITGDAIALALAFVGAHTLRYELRVGPDLTPFQYTPLIGYWPVGLTFGLVFLLLMSTHGAYSSRSSRILDDVSKVLYSSIIATSVVIILFFLFRPAFFSRLMFGYMFVGAVVSTGVWRYVVRYLASWRFRRGLDLQRVLVIGGGSIAKMLMQQLAASSSTGYLPMGFLDHPGGDGRDFGRFKLLGMVDELKEMILTHQVEKVFIALPTASSGALADSVRICREAELDFTVVPDMFELQTGRISTEEVAGIPLFTLTTNSISGFRAIQKRVLDIVVAWTALVLLSPVILLTAVAIRVDSPGKVVFGQTRIGKNGQPFRLWKFRSMVENAEDLLEQIYPEARDEVLFKRADDQRRTRVGRFIRRTSIDELPQLLNVLRGDMSMVGPRAQVPSEVAAYDEFAHNRLLVTPGLTGLWQISGRSNLSFDEMVMLDAYYIGHWSPGLDVRILLRTLPAVIRGEGAY